MPRQLSLGFEVVRMKIHGDTHETTRSLDRRAQDLSRQKGIPLTDAINIVWQDKEKILNEIGWHKARA